VLNNLPTVNVQKLFGLAITLKIGFALLGYIFHEPIWLGMVAPLTVMVAYIYVGHNKRSHDVSEEKFADSCYYIGFIFTIVTIIMCLFDVPKMTAGAGMFEIAVRFGSAMVSTVFGMIVRVYLVGFKKDATDAVKDVEAALVETTRGFTLQLQDTIHTLQGFQAQVFDASKASVAGVQIQVELLGRNFSESLAQFYAELNEENRAEFQEMLAEVKTATGRLAASVEKYSSGMNGHLESIEHRVTEFADAVSTRLQNTTFPDDYFAAQLSEPLNLLKAEAGVLGESVRGVSDQVKASSSTLGEVLKTISTKTKKTQGAMDAIVDLSERHHVLLTNAGLQLNALQGFAQRLENMDAAMRGVLDVIGTSSTASSELLAKVSTLATGTQDLRTDITATIETLTSKLDANATLADGVIQRLESHVARLLAGADVVIASLEKTAQSTETSGLHIAASAGEFKAISAATIAATAGLENASRRANDAAVAATAAANLASQAARSVVPLNSDINLQNGGLREMADAPRRSVDATPVPLELTQPTGWRSLTRGPGRIASFAGLGNKQNGQSGPLIGRDLAADEPEKSPLDNRRESNL
jgi:hypothetical protein